MPHKIWHLRIIHLKVFSFEILSHITVLAVLTQVSHQLRLAIMVEIEAGARLVSGVASSLSSWQCAADGCTGHTRHHWAQGTAVRLLQCGIVSLMVNNVKRSIEQ